MNGAFIETEAINEEDLPEEGKPELIFPLGFFIFQNNRPIDPGGATVTVTLILPENCL